MEITIGVQNNPRELSVEVDSTASEVADRIKDAIDKGTLLSLTDPKGRTVLVPAASIAYIEIGAETHYRVGFGAL
ncbi:DUF3107 domain-containing protein [Rarobacter incanus]|uniref:Uncharacterized protein DUF3107 n=1 Tax=Rarobacter incanus TaxID=153494 RepID=A0A542SRA9_9MICO|nr:DUF3107 domain-containing protein [Rarobacter incanus]TQK77160.1 uncharacterized protein DUF3107 [Rarobacter incanus]